MKPTEPTALAQLLLSLFNINSAFLSHVIGVILLLSIAAVSFILLNTN